MNKIKKKYEKPSMEVFELKQQPQILAGSSLDDPNDYNNGGNPFGGS
ncbi:MAG: hypothetical protein J5502_11005 [Prevotella sp.]|nr:hypothetical protein [Prevotella sp.]